MGFTAWSGTKVEGTTSDLVQITQVDVVNMDETSVGEELDASDDMKAAYKEAFADKNNNFEDQKAQTVHLVKLASMLEEYTDSTKPAEESLYGKLQAFENRVHILGTQCKDEVQEVKLLMADAGAAQGITGPGAHKAGVDAMVNEIIGLRRLLVKDSASHRQKLDAVSKNVAEVKEKSGQEGNRDGLLSQISQQSDVLEQTVQSRGSHMSLMFFFLVAVVVVIGWMMYNRMRYYENKHFI